MRKWACERLGFHRIVPFRQRARTLHFSVFCSCRTGGIEIWAFMWASGCYDSCTAVFAWRVWQVYSLPCWCQSFAGCVLLVGSSADMVLPPDLLKVSGPQVLGSSVILFGCPAVSEDGLIAG